MKNHSRRKDLRPITVATTNQMKDQLKIFIKPRQSNALHVGNQES